MNATVTRSATKTAASKDTGKKTPVPVKTKTAGGKTAKAGSAALKTSTTAPKDGAKAAVKAVAKPAVKALSKPAVSKTATSKKITPEAKPSPVKSAADKKKSPAAAKPISDVAAKAEPNAAETGVVMSGNKVDANLSDKIEQTEVSKVSEVATKTTKPTPSVPADGAMLTEAQILAMDEKDYMNEAQLAFFRARLQQLEKDLLKNAGETTEHLRETVLVPDPADRATIEEEHALELRTRDRERKLLKKVQQSIASIDAGEYGWCEETGEPIGIPRLLARPTATLSLEAQQRRELKQKLYGD